MKKDYTTPEMEILFLEQCDIVTTSGISANGTRLDTNANDALTTGSWGDGSWSWS